MQFLEFKNSASPLSEMEVELKFKLYIFSRLFELAISIKAYLECIHASLNDVLNGTNKIHFIKSSSYLQSLIK